MHRPIFMSPAQMGAFLARFDPGGRHKWVSPAQKIPGGRERGKRFISLRRKKKNSCNRQRKDHGGEKGVWQFHK